MFGAIVAVIIVLFVGVFMISKDAKTQEEGPIKIAFVGPLSGDGAAWGDIERNTIELAVEEINAEGGINGRQIVFSAEDGKCDGKTAVSAVQKLIEVDQVKILLVSCSQEVVPVAPIAEEAGVIVFTSYASASTISGIGSYTFRNSYTNNDMSKAMADVAIEEGTRAAIITEQSAFASDLKDLFIENYMAQGGEMVAVEDFQQESKDLRTQVAKMLAENPDVVVINPNGPATGIAILKQLAEQGYEGALVGNFFGGSKEVQDTAEAKGMVYVSDPVFADSAAKRDLFAKYEERFGSAPDLEWPVGARYDAVQILKRAFEEVGDDPTAVRDYLSTMPDFTGILGTYRFDENHDITNVKPVVNTI